MKILIYSDPHFCQYSSIVRSNGEKYSTRLENLIKSLNWVEETAQKENCDTIICAGDFFDKAELNAQEITALSDVKFDEKIAHYYLCGNHEMGAYNHKYSSTKIFDGYDNSFSIDKPFCLHDDSAEILFLPYLLEKERKTVHDYVEEYIADKGKIIVVMSHNNIKMNYGGYFLEDGFDIEDIVHNCDWFFNGHLHNGGFIEKYQNIINIGNLTGQNFSENAFLYSHGIYIIDTDHLNMAEELKYIENPFAFNFYKVDFTTSTEYSALKKNAVVSLVCYEEDIEKYRSSFCDSGIISFKIQAKQRKANEIKKEQDEQIEAIDHIQKFRDFVLSEIGSDDIIKSELSFIG